MFDFRVKEFTGKGRNSHDQKGNTAEALGKVSGEKGISGME